MKLGHLPFAFLFVLGGCGASAQQHRTLNTITDAADPTYAAAVGTCDALRDAIVAREGTTYEEDRADMDSVHEVCDPIVLGFETLRGTQLTAREAIDGGLEGAAAESISNAMQLWPRVRALVQRLTGGEGE